MEAGRANPVFGVRDVATSVVSRSGGLASGGLWLFFHSWLDGPQIVDKLKLMSKLNR